MARAIDTDPLTGQIQLTSEFEVHVANYNNWSVGSSILEVFPEITGLIRIEDVPVDVMKD